MPSSHLILCHPLLFLPPIPLSIKVFSNESALRMRWPKDCSFSFSIIPSKEHPGLISFRMDWLDLLAVQGTPKSILQHHSSKKKKGINSLALSLLHSPTLREYKDGVIYKVRARLKVTLRKDKISRYYQQLVCNSHQDWLLPSLVLRGK